MYTIEKENTFSPGLAWDLRDKGILLLRLYEKALQCMSEAVALMKAGKVVEKGERLIRAQDIVLQLADALDGEAASGSRGIAANLSQLYLYIYRRLIRGNNYLDIDAVLEARGLMEKLYTAWKQALSRTFCAAGDSGLCAGI